MVILNHKNRSNGVRVEARDYTEAVVPCSFVFYMNPTMRRITENENNNVKNLI